MVALTSPVATEPAAITSRDSAFAMSRTTDCTESCRSAVVDASYASDTRTDKVQLPSMGSHVTVDATARVPIDEGARLALAPCGLKPKL